MSGENLDLLTMFLNLLNTRMPSRDQEPAEFQIDDTYSVPVMIFLSIEALPSHLSLNFGLILGCWHSSFRNNITGNNSFKRYFIIRARHVRPFYTDCCEKYT